MKKGDYKEEVRKVKRRAKILAVIAIAFILLAVSYQLIRASYTLDLFSATKYNAFQIGMSEVRAKSLFSAYGELSSTIETKEMEPLGKVKILTFTTEEFEEILSLYFTDGKLSGFTYGNIKVGRE